MEKDLSIIGKIFEKLLSITDSEIDKPIQMKIDNCDEEKINYHVQLLKKSEHIKVKSDNQGKEYPTRIQGKGLDYIERNFNIVFGKELELRKK